MSSFINFYIFSIMKQMEPLFLYAIKNAKQIYLFHIYKQIKCSNNWKIKSLIEGMLVSLLRLSIYILWTKPAIPSWIVFPENSAKLLIIRKKKLFETHKMFLVRMSEVQPLLVENDFLGIFKRTVKVTDGCWILIHSHWVFIKYNFSRVLSSYLNKIRRTWLNLNSGQKLYILN